MNHVLKNTAVLFLVAACVVLWARCNGGNGQADGDADDIARDDETADSPSDRIGEDADDAADFDEGEQDPNDPCNGLDDDGDTVCDNVFACCAGRSGTQACGNCGTQERACGDDCAWGEWDACAGEGPCEPGEPQSQACGNCGTQERACGDDCAWGAWGGCAGEGPCAPATTVACTNHCGSSTKTCDDTCRWGPCGPPFDMTQFYPQPTDKALLYEHESGAHEKVLWDQWAPPDEHVFTIRHLWPDAGPEFCHTRHPRIDDVFVWDYGGGMLWYTDTFGWKDCNHMHEDFRWALRCMDLGVVYGGVYGNPTARHMESPCVEADSANCMMGDTEAAPHWTDNVEYLTGIFRAEQSSPFTGTVQTIRHDVTSCHINNCEHGPPEGSFCLARGEEHWWFWWDSAQQRFIRTRHQGLYFNPGDYIGLRPECTAEECSPTHEITWQIENCWKESWGHAADRHHRPVDHPFP